MEWSWLNFVVTWLKIFKPNDSTKKLSQMVLSQVTGNQTNVYLPPPIHDTFWIDWGNECAMCLKFRQFNLDLGFLGEWNFPNATKTGFASRFSLIVALTPMMAGKNFTSDKDAL